MPFPELTNEQRRQLIDVQQAFAAWRPAAMELAKLGTLRAQALEAGRQRLATTASKDIRDQGALHATAARITRQQKMRLPSAGRPTSEPEPWCQTRRV
jgi:hypothetical protein